jgi:VanZ family protein
MVLKRGHHPHTLFRYLLLLALALITYLAFTPLPFPIASNLNDKFSHLIAFLCLALLADFSWPDSPWNLPKFLSLSGYGLFIESVQAMLPYRDFSLWDLLADNIGLAGYGLIWPLLQRNPYIRKLRG